MIWENLLVDRHPTASETAAGLARAFAGPVDDVLVVPDIGDATVGPGVRLLADLVPKGGDFPALLTIFLRDPSLEPRDRETTIGRFCEALGAACLMPDESIDPFAMLLVRSPTDRQRVGLDPERFDADEYVVARTMAAEREGSPVG